MTQQYLIGELLLRLSRLRSVAVCPDAQSALDRLRAEAEVLRPGDLGPVVLRALAVADTMCRESLSVGDAAGFSRQSRAAADVFEFGTCSGLLTEPD